MAGSKDDIKVIVPPVHRRGVERDIELHKRCLERRTLTLMLRRKRGGELRVAAREADKILCVLQVLLGGSSCTRSLIRGVFTVRRVLAVWE